MARGTRFGCSMTGHRHGAGHAGTGAARGVRVVGLLLLGCSLWGWLWGGSLLRQAPTRPSHACSGGSPQRQGSMQPTSHLWGLLISRDEERGRQAVAPLLLLLLRMLWPVGAPSTREAAILRVVRRRSFRAQPGSGCKMKTPRARLAFTHHARCDAWKMRVQVMHEVS